MWLDTTVAPLLSMVTSESLSLPSGHQEELGKYQWDTDYQLHSRKIG